MKNYAILTWNVIKSRVVRPIIYFIYSILILIFLFDSFLMPWFVNRGGTQQVPNVVGLKKEVAMQLLDSIHLEPREGEIRADNSYPEGFVVGQNPLSDQIVKSGR